LDPEATVKAIDELGGLDLGDLGHIDPAIGDLILAGRAMDTIVMNNGETIEPKPLQDAILGCSAGLLEQVMLTGQNGRRDRSDYGGESYRIGQCRIFEMFEISENCSSREQNKDATKECNLLICILYP
jgi:hypothetical protein